MRKLLLAAALLLAVPTASRAEFGLGLRIGYGMPGGDALKADTGSGLTAFKYSDLLSSQTNFQIDAMFKTGPSTAAGIYLGYAPNKLAGTPAVSCDTAGVSCSSYTLRAGLQFTGEFLDLGIVGLWGGIGTGIEAAYATQEGGGAKIDAQLRGWEWATISAGADLKLVKLINAGLYISYGFGQFTVQEVKLTSPLGSMEENGGLGSNATTHNMFQIGLRGMFNL
jgi:hypothetical protein